MYICFCVYARHAGFVSLCVKCRRTLKGTLAQKQLAVKTEKSKSWFIHIKQLLLKYDLPSAYELLDAPPGKMDWKTRVSDAVNFYWNQETRKASTKTSQKYLNIDALEIGTVHPVWRILSSNTREVEMVAVKAKLLTGTYVLQANCARFNQFQVNPICTICEEPEDRHHFILRCRSLVGSRDVHMKKINLYLHEIYEDDIADAILSDENTLLQIILDCTNKSLVDEAISSQLSTLCDDIEPMTRRLCFSLHVKRAALLNIYIGWGCLCKPFP